MTIFAMFLIVFCSAGILACLVYILYQLQKEKMENYAEQKISERFGNSRDKRTYKNEDSFSKTKRRTQK